MACESKMTKEFAHKNASLEALTSLRELSQPVYAIMREHEDWIVPSSITTRTARTASPPNRYSTLSMRETPSASTLPHGTFSPRRGCRPARRLIDQVRLRQQPEDTTQAAVNRRDLSGLLSKIESEEIHRKHVGTYVQAADDPRDDRPRLRRHNFQLTLLHQT